MTDGYSGRSIRAIEVKDGSPSRPIYIIVVILLMFLLLTIPGFYYILNDGINEGPSGDEGKEKDTELVLTLLDAPDLLISDTRMTFYGEVKTQKGADIDGVSVAVSIPGISENIFRSVSDPNGIFEVLVELPSFEGEGTFKVNITAEKANYISDSLSFEKEYRPPPKWTFMIYMSDCDLESWALKDINELESIGSSPLVDIIVQLDRWESLSPKDDRTDGNWTTAKRFRIGHDDESEMITSEELSDIGEIDSANPEELVEFATWSMDNYPADHTALILWNHGSGTDGICWEQSLEEEEVMKIDQLGWALDRITSHLGRDLDILGFDACLMSAFEVAYEISPYCDLMVGSEITEPAYGWDYLTLGKLKQDPYISPASLSEQFMVDYLDQMGKLGSKTSMSMGVYDLKRMDAIARSLNALSNTIAESGSAELYNMNIARKYAQPIQEGHTSDAVDLFDFVENIQKLTETPSIRELSQTVLDDINNAVLNFNSTQVGGWSIDGLKGLSIYAPDFRDVMDQNNDYSDLKFVKDTSWTALLSTYFDHLEGTGSPRILHFDTAFLSCTTTDEDGDGCRDTMKHQYSVQSDEDDVEAFLGINIYNLRGDHISSLGHSFNISSNEKKTFTVSFMLEEEEGGPGLYRIVSYLCTGNSFDRGYFQDYTRSAYRWLEVCSE